MKYMIIGASIAAINAIEAIRRRDPHSPITVISEETDPPYSRPLISYWLAGVISDAEMLYRPRDFYQKHRVNLLVGKKAVHLNPATKTVWLDTGDALEYDTLLLACGGKNTVPPGLANVPYHTFYSWRDVREIAAKVREKGPGQHALVVGAGLVGMKAAESLRLLGVEVTVVDLADHILSSVLPQGPSKLLEALLCEDSKLHFYLGATATDVRADSGKITCRIMGMPMAFDHLVLAVGVRPNIDLCKGTPIETNKGVLVDERMQTSVPHHYAAGDLAEMRGGAWG
ncbi:MAG: FAD-dependent oxidoreductase, partial [Firmicutes bacterium]|nr:FAD-dependent oxidoreductase [Bacillota bacterium]